MTSPEKTPDQTPRKNYSHFFGWLDLLGSAVQEIAPRVGRAHIQIADAVFSRLDRLPLALPVVNMTRTLHHLIAGATYRSVTYGGAGLSYAARLHFRRDTRRSLGLAEGENAAIRRSGGPEARHLRASDDGR